MIIGLLVSGGNTGDPLNVQASELYKKDREKFNEIVKEYIKDYNIEW
jgi:ubiquitin-protein ligase